MHEDKGIPVEEFFSDVKDVVVMGSEPMPDMTVEDAKKWYEAHENEAGLAEIYANVYNKASWVDDEVYDYEKGTKEYEDACSIADEWWALSDLYEGLILNLLKNEGLEIPEKGYISVLRIFMDRNGYKDGSGWWIKKEKSGDAL